MVDPASRPAPGALAPSAAPRRIAGTIGPLTVAVRGERPFVDAVGRELTPLDAGAPEPDIPDLDILVAPARAFMADYQPTTYSAKTHMSFRDDAFSADEPVRFVASGLFDPGPGIRLALDDRTEARVAYLRRTFGRTIDAHPALSYALLWFVIHVRLLQHSASSIHAGIVEIDGRATAIAGTGGSGKTSLLFTLLEAPDARYLAEDFGIVAADGTVHLSPKAISIYSSDLAGSSEALEAYVRSRPAAQRLKWLVHRRILRTTPMVKAPVAAILPADKVATSAPLERVLYLVRRADDRVRVHDATADDLATRLTDVAWREHKRLLELVRMIRANAGATTQVPTVEALTAQTHGTLESAMRGAACYLVEVPARMGPERILDALRKERVLA